MKINRAKTNFLEIRFKNKVGRKRRDHNVRHDGQYVITVKKSSI